MINDNFSSNCPMPPRLIKSLGTSLPAKKPVGSRAPQLSRRPSQLGNQEYLSYHIVSLVTLGLWQKVWGVIWVLPGITGCSSLISCVNPPCWVSFQLIVFCHSQSCQLKTRIKKCFKAHRVKMFVWRIWDMSRVCLNRRDALCCEANQRRAQTLFRFDRDDWL